MYKSILNNLLAFKDKLKVKIEKAPFNENDIRKDFLGLIWDILHNYYKGYCLLLISDLINTNKIALDKSIYDHKPHFDKVCELTKVDILKQGQINYLNRGLLIDVWSTFELCVTTFTNGIVNDDEKEKLLSFEYNNILKHLKNTFLNKTDNETLSKSLRKTHLTHVPIVRKIDLLFKKTVEYSREIEEDKKFLAFLGKLRNTMHTNFIYYGKDYTYTFNDTSFLFVNEKVVEWDAYDNLWLDLVDTLISIWLEIIRTIKHDNVILYPDLNSD